MKDLVKSRGFIEGKITYKNTDEIKTVRFDNTILAGGKEFLAKCLLEDAPKLHITHMLFGDGGTVNGNAKIISPTQDKMFGVTRVRKPVVAQVDPETPTQIIFSVVVNEEEGNDFPLNEMALELSDGTLFNLSTFADLNKTEQMEIAWSWFVCFA